MSNTTKAKPSAKRALELESAATDPVSDLPESVDVEFDGVVYSVNPRLLDNIEVIEAVEDNRMAATARAFLGPRQWADFKQSHSSYSKDLTLLVNRIFEVIGGITPGESKG